MSGDQRKPYGYDEMSNGLRSDAERVAATIDRPVASRWDLDRLVAELRLSREETHSIRKGGAIHRPPSREKLAQIIAGLTEALFPRHYGQHDLDGGNIDYLVGHSLSIALNVLSEQIHRAALFVGDELLPGFRQPEAIDFTRSFAPQLPALRGLLISDLRAAFVGDPAAKSFPEILIGYPGMTAVIHHRLAHIDDRRQCLADQRRAVEQRGHPGQPAQQDWRPCCRTKIAITRPTPEPVRLRLRLGDHTHSAATLCGPRQSADA
jgi:hypothetical protein